MTTTKQNLTMYAGDTASITVGVSNADGNAASLAGASAVWVVEDQVGSGSFIRKTIDDDISVSGSTVTISVCPTDTSELGGGTYYHELEITDASGNVSTTTTGLITIKKSGANL